MAQIFYQCLGVIPSRYSLYISLAQLCNSQQTAQLK